LRKAIVGVVAGALFLALAAVAYALTNNTATYSSTLQQPSGKKPLNIGYTGILDVGTSDNTQPNTAPLTEVFFASQLKNNAKLFAKHGKVCKESDVNGQGSIPAKCKKAVVGGGHANAKVGSPGSSSSIPQDLDVVALNGEGGKELMLAVIGGALQSYAVIPGKLVTSGVSSPFGYKVNFEVPAQLQGTLGTQIALTHFDVAITPKNIVKLKGPKPKNKHKKRKVKRVAYLQLTKCPSSKTLPTKAIVHFNNDDNTPGGQVVPSDGTMTCK
jgi:hypothetical protein